MLLHWLDKSLQDIHAVDLYKELEKNDSSNLSVFYSRILALSILRGDESDYVDTLKNKIDTLLKVNKQDIAIAVVDIMILVNENANEYPPLPGITSSSLYWLDQNISADEILNAASICISDPSQMATIIFPLIREILHSTALIEETALLDRTEQAPIKNKSRLLRL